MTGGWTLGDLSRVQLSLLSLVLPGGSVSDAAWSILQLHKHEDVRAMLHALLYLLCSFHVV